MARPRKANVKRDSTTGRSRGEQTVHPETLAIRERHLRQDGIILQFKKMEGYREVIKLTAQDARSGYSLGRLFLRYEQGDKALGISRDQFQTGEAWGRLCHSHAAIMGYRRGVGGSSKGELDDDEIIAIRRKWSDCYNCLMTACAGDIRVRDVTYGICVDDWPVSWLDFNDCGKLRLGLNGIKRALDGSPKKL